MPTIFTLPWRWTEQARPETTVVFASRTDGTGLRAGWRLFVGGIRLGGAVLRSPGALGVSVRAHPLKGHYYTMSMWEDEASLLTFAHNADHQAAVRHVAELGTVAGVLLSRESDARRPRWRETLRWLASAEPGPYRRDSTRQGVLDPWGQKSA
jgi:hypothetical protein